MKELLEEKIRRKFWDLQNSQQQRIADEENEYDIKKRSAIYSGEQVFPVERYRREICSAICSEWNKFCEEFVVKEIEGLTLLIDAKDAKEETPAINCCNWIFHFKVEIRGAFGKTSFTGSIFKSEISTSYGFVAMVNFAGAKFYEGIIFNGVLLEADFACAEFFELASFCSVSFESFARFSCCRFENCKVVFQHSKCAKEIYFDAIKVAKKVSFEFTESKFLDEFHFYTAADFMDGSEITKIDLSGSEFEKTTLFRQELSSNGRFVGVGNLMLRATIFRELLTIKFQHLEICPDFSKSDLLDIKKLSLNEKSWEKNDEISQQEITEDDEEKFRFLKKYFAEQGNHFKEQEYFSYEMKAHQKELLSRVFSRGIFPIISWLRNLFELLLFFAYKLTSNFGMSWVRPAFWLLVSSRLMALKLDQIPPINLIGKFGEFFGFVENSTVGFPEALTRTLSPLSTAKIFETTIDWAGNLAGNLLCLANAILIFLLLLGIRNKFKIK